MLLQGMLQGVAGCCRVLQGVAVCCKMLQCVYKTSYGIMRNSLLVPLTPINVCVCVCV